MPAPTPVTTPEEFTVATLGLSVIQHGPNLACFTFAGDVVTIDVKRALVEQAQGSPIGSPGRPGSRPQDGPGQPRKC